MQKKKLLRALEKGAGRPPLALAFCPSPQAPRTCCCGVTIRPRRVRGKRKTPLSCDQKSMVTMMQQQRRCWRFEVTCSHEEKVEKRSCPDSFLPLLFLPWAREPSGAAAAGSTPPSSAALAPSLRWCPLPPPAPSAPPSQGFPPCAPSAGSCASFLAAPAACAITSVVLSRGGAYAVLTQ